MKTKARRSRYLSGLIALAVVSVALGGCWRRSKYYQPPPVDGLKFFAVSYLKGAANDSVFVRVSVRNDASAARRIEGGICGDQVTVRLYRGMSGKSPAWDSSAWRRATDPPNTVCLAVAVMYSLRAGQAIDIGIITLPTRAILGDTLAAGVYRVGAFANNSTAQAGETKAGVVELRAP